MPLEVVVELQVRAISCPGVFLPGKQDVYLGIYFLNQYLETDCFPPVFPLMIQQSMKFEKVFENAIDPGTVADILEGFLTRFELIQLVPPAWEELAYYEENTRDFLFPEPRLTTPHPGLYREVLMKTVAGFPGIAPKLEFHTRTAIRECAFLHENRFLEERYKSQKPFYTSCGSKFHLSNVKMKPKESNLERLPEGMQSWAPSPHSTSRFLQDQPAQLNLRNNFKSKPPFVVRHVDSAKPFGENISDYHSRKSRRKSNFSDFPYLMKRVSSLDSFAANVKVVNHVFFKLDQFVKVKAQISILQHENRCMPKKVIKEPDERIILRNESPSTLDSSKFGKPSLSYSNQGDADFHRETSLATSQHSRSLSPLLDQPLLRERFHPSSQSTWKKIHERVCSLLTSHGAQKYLNKEDSIDEVNDIFERPRYPLKKYPVHEDRYF